MSEQIIIDREAPPWAQRLQTDLNAALIRLDRRVMTIGDALEGMPTGSVAAAAWVNFNGTGAVAIRDQYNVASITDNGTGDYTINLTEPMGDANYSVVGSIGGTAGLVGWTVRDDITPRTTTAFRINTFNGAFALTDAAQINLAVFGDA
jgi:hypothetical protein